MYCRLVVQSKGSNLVVAAAADDTLAIRMVNMLTARGAINIVFHQLADEERKNNMRLSDKIK